ncbi:MAG TPA: RICIN domain-containing protein, partial [Acetivibrio sp.]|nr:RICIN domain-containing protein [Acetivibrio sp.]
SGCTGWKPNQAKYAYSRDLASGWSSLYNLGNSTTYNSQPAYIVAVQGTEETSYLYTGDRWAGAWGGKVNDSQYVWLPLEFVSDTKLELPYYDSITIDAAKGKIYENFNNPPLYKIMNKNSGKLLDVQDGSMENAAQIVQWSDNGSLSQQWYIVDVGNGYKRIVNAKSKKTLDVMNDSADNGGILIQYTSTGGYNQQWKFADAGDGYYKIVSRSSGKLVDVYKWSTEDGATIQQWADAEGSNQHWKLIPVENTEPTPTPTVKPTPTATLKPTPTDAKAIVLGDVNGDLSVDSTDITLMKRYMLRKISQFPDSNGKIAADVNGDSSVDSTDLTLVKRYVLKKIDKFPAQ